MGEKFFDRAYGLDTQEKVDQLYENWAETYDKEVTGYGYASPQRCAEALRKFLSVDKPILDFGCGTGLSGLALREQGFEVIDGSELSDPMREKAEDINVYRQLFKGDVDDPFPFPLGNYEAITAVGVISSGAGPAELLSSSLNQLTNGQLLCFSFNDHTLDDAAYMDALEMVLSNAMAEKIFEEYGDHLPARNVNSMVYVLRRL